MGDILTPSDHKVDDNVLPLNKEDFFARDLQVGHAIISVGPGIIM